jgi:TPR repeat protein
VSRDVPPLALDSGDPWERVEIDPSTCRLAERAAAAAGIAVEEWLERAIRRACPKAFGSASATPPRALPAARAEAPARRESPFIVRRAPTIAERLAQQRRGHAEDAKAAPSAVPVKDVSAARSAEAEAQTLFTAAASRDADDVDKLLAKLKAMAANAQQLAPPRHRAAHRAAIAVAIALTITGGAVTAQYIVPGHSRAPTQSNATPSPSAKDSSSGISNAASAVALAATPSLQSPSSNPATAARNPPPPAAPNPPSAASAPTSLASLPASPAPSASPLAAPRAETSAASPPVTAKPQAATPPAQAKPETSAKPNATAPAALVPKEAAPGKTASAATPPRPGKDDVAPSDPKALAPWLEQRAKSGDLIAQYRLGVLYALGQGVRQDYQHAAQLFKTAAEGGVAEAQYNIGVLYERGLGVGRDDLQAAQWYQKAAAQGNANAAFNLGVAYSNGAGVAQSMDQAAQWFRRAAAAGIINAQFNLGLLYERGDGVPVSQVEAFAWYTAAAARGDSGAAQRRDRLASLLAARTLKEARARADQVAATIKNGTPATVSSVSADRSAAP